MNLEELQEMYETFMKKQNDVINTLIENEKYLIEKTNEKNEQIAKYDTIRTLIVSICVMIGILIFVICYAFRIF